MVLQAHPRAICTISLIGQKYFFNINGKLGYYGHESGGYNFTSNIILRKHFVYVELLEAKNYTTAHELLTKNTTKET